MHLTTLLSLGKWRIPMAVAGILGILSINAWACDTCKGKVPLTFLARYCAEDTIRVTITNKEDSGDFVQLTGAGTNCGGFTDTAKKSFKIEPLKEYEVKSDAGVIRSIHLSFETEPCYDVYIDGKQTQNIDQDTYTCEYQEEATYTLVIKPKGDNSGAGTGGDGGGDQNSVHWWFSMGGLGNGTGAGSIIISKGTIDATTYTPSVLAYWTPSSAVEIIKNGTNLRQVKAPEVLADIVTISSTKFEIRYYISANAGSKSGGVYQPMGNPFVTWTVENPPGGAVGDLRITETRGAITKVANFSYVASTHAWTFNYANLRQVTETTSQESGDTWVTRTVSNPTTGQIALKTKERRHMFAWGEEVITHIDDPDGNALTTTDTYEENSASGGYAKVKTVIYPTGNWEKYEYSSEDGSNFGLLTRVYRPWKDGPATPDQATESNCYVIENSNFSSPDYGILHTYPTSTQTSVLGVSTGGTYRTISRNTQDGQPITTESTGVYDAQGQNLEGTETRATYDSNAALPYAGKTAYVHFSDGRQDTYSYALGNYVASTGIFTAGSGAYTQQILTRGAPYAVANKSTRTITVFNSYGQPVYEEEQVCTGGSSFASLSKTKLDYTSNGKLNQKTKDGRITYEATWTDGRKMTETDEAGIVTNFGYDDLERTTTETRIGIETTYHYDAEGRVRSITRSSESLSLGSNQDYDYAGRLTSETSEDGLTTGTAYTQAGRVITRTPPSSGTEITELYLNGQTKSVTGTGVVAQNYDYGADATGMWTRRSNGSRYEKSWQNQAGNIVRSEQPAYSGISTINYQYNTYGRLVSRTVPGETGILLTYDYATGDLYQQGRDANANGLLETGGSDRIDQTDVSYQQISGAWYRVAVQSRYESNGNSTPTSILTTKEQISGLPTNTISKTLTINRYNQTTTTTVTVDRSTKTVTETADTPDSNINAVRISINGLLKSTTTTTVAQPTTYDLYDGLGRLKQSTDPRSVQTTYNYGPTTGQLSSVTEAGKTTSYEYYPTGQAGAGQTKSTLIMGSARDYQDYNLRGQLVHTWGGTAYPTELVYDSQYGDRTGLKTYRGGSGWDTASSWPGASGGDATTWAYQPSTGLLLSRSDASNHAVSYTYYPSGNIKTRLWARGVSTTYHYNAFGEPVLVDYSDSTPDVSMTYDRVGRLATLRDYAGKHVYSYLNTQNTETISEYGVLNGVVFATQFNGYGQKSGFSSTSYSGLPWTRQISYGYNNSRLQAVSSNYSAGTANYTYLPNSDLLYTTILYTSGTARLTITRNWDSSNRLKSITNSWSGGSQTFDTTTFDAMNRRQQVTWADGSWWDYGYDGRGEINSGSRKWDSGATVAGQQYTYNFDNIGNRLTATVNGRVSTYTPNALNQYDQRTVPGAYDIFGTAASTATVKVDGTTTQRNGSYFYKKVVATNANAPVSQTSAIVASLSGSSTTRNITQFVPKTPEVFNYDLDGNLHSDGQWIYTWDGENRLIGMDNSAIPNMPASAKCRLSFAYDAQGRRIRSQVWRTVPNGSGNLILHHTIRFLYDEWKLVAELADGGEPIRTYLWGLDVSGSLDGAGGIGGLLWENPGFTLGNVHELAVGYDLNGNVTALADGSGQIRAQYEYGPFGELLRASGEYAALNPFQWSTKYTDHESGLVYYGGNGGNGKPGRGRYYSPTLGRWLSQDPLGDIAFFDEYTKDKSWDEYDRLFEESLQSPYLFVGNDPVNEVDPFGLATYEFKGGTKEQENKVRAAADQAGSYVRRASADMDRYDSRNQRLTYFPRMRFEKWFGKFDSGRYQTVKSNYQSTAALYNGKIKFDLCPTKKVGKNTAAWVYPGGEVEIFIAPRFWGLGGREQTRVIIHETTHEAFGSQDFDIYGSSQSQDMARTNPARAIQHADNYSFHAME